MNYINSTETIGEYLVRDLVLSVNRPVIVGYMQDPETLKWYKQEWNSETGENLRKNFNTDLKL